MTLVNMVYPE